MRQADRVLPPNKNILLCFYTIPSTEYKFKSTFYKYKKCSSDKTFHPETCMEANTRFRRKKLFLNIRWTQWRDSHWLHGALDQSYREYIGPMPPALKQLGFRPSYPTCDIRTSCSPWDLSCCPRGWLHSEQGVSWIKNGKCASWTEHSDF